MSKKTNTLLFILAGTVFNVLVILISFVVLFILFVRFLAPILPENIAAFGFIVVIIGAVALSVVAYRVVIKQITKRVDLDKYFDPIFGSRRPPVRRD